MSALLSISLNKLNKEIVDQMQNSDEQLFYNNFCRALWDLQAVEVESKATICPTFSVLSSVMVIIN